MLIVAAAITAATLAVPAGEFRIQPADSGRLVRNYFEAGARTRRASGWYAPTVSPNTAVLSRLGTLRDRSRAAVRNNGVAKGAIQKLVTNLVGVGIKPLSKAKDPELRLEISRVWDIWTDQCSACGMLEFYGLQSQSVWGWLEGGEEFTRLRNRQPGDGLIVPLQLEVLEPELVPYTHDRQLPSGNRIRAGVEFNGIGRRVAYWFHPSRPELDDFDATTLVRVPAESVAHMYFPYRAGQIRGIPHLTHALIKLDDLDKFDDATLRKQQISNLFTAFIKRQMGTGSGDNINPVTGLAQDTPAGEDRPMVTLEPATVQELGLGEEMQFANPPGVADTYEAFMRQQLRAVANAVDVPYEILTGDMTGMSDRTVRVILNEFRRRLMAWQHQIIAFQFCRPVWNAFIDRAYLSGAIRFPADFVANRDAYAAVEWIPHTWPYIHPVQDVTAARESVKAGFTSRQAVVSELGDDAAQIDDQQADDNARADARNLRYTSDSRQANASATDPAPPDDPDANENAGAKQ